MSNKTFHTLDDKSDFDEAESSHTISKPATCDDDKTAATDQTTELSNCLEPTKAMETLHINSFEKEKAKDIPQSLQVANEMLDIDNTSINNEQVSVSTFTIGSISTLIVMVQTLNNDDEKNPEILLQNTEEVKETEDENIPIEKTLNFDDKNNPMANEDVSGSKKQTNKKESSDLVSSDKHKLRKSMYCTALSQFLFILSFGVIYYLSHFKSTIMAESPSMEVILYILIAVCQVARGYYAYILYIGAKKESVSTVTFAANYCPWMWLYHACVCIWAFINFILLKSTVWNIMICVYLGVQLISSCAFFVREETIIDSYKDVLIKRLFRTFTRNKSQSTDF